MSGGGYSPPEVDVGGMGPTDCSRLSFVAILTSVDLDVLASCAVGDPLHVQLHGSAPTLFIGVYSQSTGLLLGTITTRWAELKKCLDLGALFHAELLSNSAPVRVQVAAGP